MAVEVGPLGWTKAVGVGLSGMEIKPWRVPLPLQPREDTEKLLSMAQGASPCQIPNLPPI